MRNNLPSIGSNSPSSSKRKRILAVAYRSVRSSTFMAAVTKCVNSALLSSLTWKINFMWNSKCAFVGRSARAELIKIFSIFGAESENLPIHCWCTTLIWEEEVRRRIYMLLRWYHLRHSTALDLWWWVKLVEALFCVKQIKCKFAIFNLPQTHPQPSSSDPWNQSQSSVHPLISRIGIWKFQFSSHLHIMEKLNSQASARAA